MAEINVKKVSATGIAASEVPAMMEANDVEWQRIGCVNWPEQFPYKPEVQFRIAHNGKEIMLQFKVSEQQLLADVKSDNGDVYKDSCCEFFLQPEAGGPYYNIETNCIGVVLMEVGMMRGAGREKAPVELLQGVRRWSSVSDGELPEGHSDWQLTIAVPCSTFFRHDITELSGKKMRCNFYKTGDNLRVPHYLSWSAIATPRPDFHRPEFFGEICFQ